MEAHNISGEQRSERAIEQVKRKYSKPVAKLDKDDKILAVYYSLGEAGRSIKGVEKDMMHISKVCNGKRKTAYGYKWKFITFDEYQQLKK